MQILKWETQVFNLSLFKTNGTVMNISATTMDPITKALEPAKMQKAADLFQVRRWESDRLRGQVYLLIRIQAYFLAPSALKAGRESLSSEIMLCLEA